MNFKCPYCKNKLEIIGDSFLECKEHGKFQVIDNIPIFFEINLNEDTKYFQEHWKNVDIEEYPKSKIDVAKIFLSSLEINYNEKRILDAGCGDGVHLYYLNKYFPRSKLFGIDISKPALFKAQHNIKNSTLCCASVDEIPFKNNYFDISFSYGVLAYTPNPQKSFEEMCRVTKEGGYIGVWFYAKPNFINNLFLKTVRSLSSCCKKKLVNILANIIVPFLYILPIASKINLSNATWEECREIVLVNIAPENLWYPKEEDVISFFRNNNIEILNISKDDKITIWGIKE